jgi:hypothetical protein
MDEQFPVQDQHDLQATLTHDSVRQQYAESDNPNPHLLTHMDRLAALELGVPLPQELTAENDVITFAEERNSPAATLTETANSRTEISPAHHQSHLEKAAFVPGVAALPSAEQDFIGEVVELGEHAMGTAEAGEAEKPSPLVESAAALDTMREVAARGQIDGQSGRTYGLALQELRNVIYKLPQLVASSEYTAQELATLIGATRRAEDFIEPRTKNYVSTLNILSVVPVEQLQAAYLSPRDDERGVIRYVIGNEVQAPNMFEGMTAAIQLARIYGGNLQDLGRNQAAMKDPNVQAFIGRPDFIEIQINMMSTLDNNTDHAERTRTGTNAEYTTRVRDAAANILYDLGIPDALADDMRRAIDERTMLKDPEGWSYRGNERCVDRNVLGSELRSIKDNVRAIGVESLSTIYKECGIINFGNYSAAQLERMSKFATGDTALIEHLQEGDVTVVLTDGRGDHNNSMKSNANSFDKPSERTLFFEINKMSDIYRSMIKLKQAGIKPSSLAISAHGAPGYMVFGNRGDEGYFALTNASNDSMEQQTTGWGDAKPWASVEAAQGIPRIADEFMQDSQGIDDALENKGRRMVILKSCSQAKPRTIERAGPDGTEYREESTADSLAQAFSNTAVDVYGAPSVVSGRSTAEGLQYIEGGVPIPALKVTINTAGEVVHRKVDQILLRKPVIIVQPDPTAIDEMVF